VGPISARLELDITMVLLGGVSTGGSGRCSWPRHLHVLNLRKIPGGVEANTRQASSALLIVSVLAQNLLDGCRCAGGGGA
jgi:hypothetical protein